MRLSRECVQTNIIVPNTFEAPFPGPFESQDYSPKAAQGHAHGDGELNKHLLGEYLQERLQQTQENISGPPMVLNFGIEAASEHVLISLSLYIYTYIRVYMCTYEYTYTCVYRRTHLDIQI